MLGKGLVLTIIGYTLFSVFVLNGALRQISLRIKFPGDYQPFCLNERCIKINVDLVLARYPNLLVPKDKWIYPTSRRRTPINSDFDVCCPTGRTCKYCNTVRRKMTILVVDFESNSNPRVKFDQFDIPIYCACFDGRWKATTADIK